MNDKKPIEIHFPLKDSDILKLLKGVEYSNSQYINSDLQVHIKVYSSDRVKYISWENWRKLCAISYNIPLMRDIISEIDNE